jgi:PHD/YefM family antitoxin component YafN of YafNO toxin-antitoxin module
MGKTISATILRSQLSTLLDQLKAGETHFVIERNNQAEAVLLNITKFQEIMQMLEMLNRLEFIGTESYEADLRLPDFVKADYDFEYDDEPEFEPEIAIRPSRTARSRAIESAAARLGIRVIK